MKLNRDFYIRDTITVAKELIGKILVHNTDDGIIKGRIVETEAYIGSIDKASHAYNNRRTSRTEIMFGIGGFSYVFLIYGMYNCMNIVTNEIGRGEAVLIRALEPLEGIDLMIERRKTDNLKNLCSGPGKLCQAIAIDRSCNGLDLCGDKLYLESDDKSLEPFDIIATKRINIDYSEEARDFLWRFVVQSNMRKK